MKAILMEKSILFLLFFSSSAFIKFSAIVLYYDEH